MVRAVKPLSKIQKKVLFLLAWGKTYDQILEFLNAQRAKLYPKKKSAHHHQFYTKDHLFTILAHLRNKTGIKNTKDAAECRQWERDNRLSITQIEKGPTERQLSVLRLLAYGYQYAFIMRELKLSRQACMNLASQGRKRAGITDLSKNSLRVYLKLDPAPPKAFHLVNVPKEAPPATPDPMDDPCF